MHHKMVLLYKQYVEGKKLSNCYWPRAARDLMLQMLTMAQDQGVEVDAELFNQLQAPTKNWIQRKYRNEILRIIGRCSKLEWAPKRDVKGIPEVMKPNPGEQLVSGEEQVAWPEIDTLADISSHPFRPVLRESVIEWLRAKGSHQNRGALAFSFQPDAEKPIKILTADDASARRWNEILALQSSELSKTVASLLPRDICRAEPLGYEIGPPPADGKDEASANGGTIGAWITMDNKRYGITCGRVAEATALLQTLPIAVSFSVADDGADIALMEVVSCDSCKKTGSCSDCRCLCHKLAGMLRNHVTFCPPDALLGSDHYLKPGVDVYKCGAMTAMTVGKLQFANLTTETAWFGTTLRNAYIVEWDSRSKVHFAVDGDCGALYAVKVSDGFLPFALHVKTNIGPEKCTSVGIDLIHCLEQLDIKCMLPRWSFVESPADEAIEKDLDVLAKLRALSVSGSQPSLPEHENPHKAASTA